MTLSEIADTKTAWRKAEIHDLLKGFGRTVIQNSINETISNEMNIPIIEAKKMKTIKPSIVKIILKEFE